MMYRRKRRYIPKKPRRKTRTYRKKYPRRSIPRNIGLPNYLFTKLRYTVRYQASVAGGASDVRDFRLNSIFDPDATSTATGTYYQPYYHKQYSAMFQRYRVYGCLVEYRITCSSSVSNLYHPSIAMTSNCDTAPGWGSFDNAMNAKRSQFRTLIPGQNVIYFKKYYNLRSIAGVSKNEYNVAEVFQAYVTANPSRIMNVSFNFQNNDGTATVTYQTFVRLTYYVKYFDNAEPGPSGN